MKKILNYLAHRFYYRFIVIKTTDYARKMGLIPYCNIFGDAINKYNCRSFFIDSYGNTYRCKELNEYKQTYKKINK